MTDWDDRSDHFISERPICTGANSHSTYHMKKISILLADDHRVVREGLRVLVETEGDIQVVGESKTGREAIDMTLLAEGNANKQIASELGISIKTVEKHRQHLMQKLSIHDIAGLTRYAIAAGVIESSVQRTTNAPESDKGGANTAEGQRARVPSYRGSARPVNSNSSKTESWKVCR